MKALTEHVRMGRPETFRSCHFPAAICIGAAALLFVCIGCNQNQARKVKDFSKTNVVVAVLGAVDGLHGNGLEHMHWMEDGHTMPATVDGVPCWQMKIRSGSTGYLYFIIDPTFKKRSVRNVKIELEYFDEREAELAMHYDATAVRTNEGAAYTKSPQVFRLAGSKTWQKATFHVKGAGFNSAQNSGADFRMRVRPPELYFRKVTVTRE